MGEDEQSFDDRAKKHADEARQRAGAETRGPAGKPVTQPLADVVKLTLPSDPDQALVAAPIVRHWLFAPDATRTRFREFTVEVRHRRRSLVQKVRIGDRFAEAGDGYGVLKARHQRALFVMQDLWQRQGGRLVEVDGVRLGFLCASSWELEEGLFGHHGGRQKKLVRQIMQQLASIPVAVDNYIGPNGKLEDIDLTGLIRGAEFRTAKKGSANQLGFPWVEVALSSVVTQAFEASAVKPINTKVLSELGGDPAALLYPKVDLLLSSHESTELSLSHAAVRLGMTGDKQMHQSGHRRRKFEPVAKRLDGLPLSKDGCVIDAKLEPTADKRDHKLVFRRKRR